MLKRLLYESDGQDLVEYALLVGIVALGATVALQGFSNQIANVWNTISSTLSGN
jgi:pilus assembly protein Flp/PilA